VRGWVCRGGVGGSWLRALGEADKLQRPLRWTDHHGAVELGEEGTVATADSHSWRSAVCGEHEMRRGRHYATFTLRTLGGANLGLVGAGFDPTGDGAAWRSAQGWLFDTRGRLFHAGRPGAWEGRPLGDPKLKQGDVVVRLPPSAPAFGPRRSRCLCGAGHAARLRRGHPDGVAQRRAEGRHGPPRHDRPPRPAGGSAGGAAALGGRRGRHVCGRRRPLAAAHLSTRDAHIWHIICDCNITMCCNITMFSCIQFRTHHAAPSRSPPALAPPSTPSSLWP